MVLLPPLSVTVALAIAAPPDALVTTPLMEPVVDDELRLKLTFCVVWPALTEAVWVPGLNPAPEAVRL